MADRREFLAAFTGAVGGALFVAGCDDASADDEDGTRFITIRKYQAPEANVAEVFRRVQESFIPIVRGLPGFIAYYGVNAGGGIMLFVNIFDTQEHADASTAAAAAWVPDHIADLDAVRVDKFDGFAVIRAGEHA